MSKFDRFLWSALALAYLLLCAGSVFAATVTTSWTNPTTYVDGSALNVADITRTRIEYGTCTGTAFGTKLGEFVATGSATSAVSPDLAPGMYCFRAYTTAKGVESGPSSVASKVIPQPAPNPPTIVTVAVVAGVDVAPVYRILRDGTRAEQVAGFVDLGVGCTGPVVFQYRGQRYRRVPADAVRFWNTRPTAGIAAACG